MRSLACAFLVLVLWGCGPRAGEQDVAPNRWSDERLWAVLEAQDHRDMPRLCAFLADSSALVREAAALAMASVSNELSRGCLLEALADGSGAVRTAAVFALGHVADSAAIVRMVEFAGSETDTTVQRALLDASFIAMQRNGMLKDPNAILYYLDRAYGHARVRAADALRRLSDSTLQAMARDYMALFSTGLSAEVEAVLVRGLAKVGTPEALELLRFSTDADKPAVIIPNALRTLGNLLDPADDSLLFRWLGPGCIGQGALEALVGRETLSAQKCLDAAKETPDARTCIVLLGLAMKHGGGAVADTAFARLRSGDTDLRDHYLKAEEINAGVWAPYEDNLAMYMAVLKGNAHPAVRQAALQGAIIMAREQMKLARYASREAQYAGLGEVITTAINTSDAGLICAVAELLEAEEPDVINILFPSSMEKAAFAPLQPIADLEARILLSKAMAKRDGLPPPEHERPPFNHPIVKARLLALKQGQQYRIVTNKGEVIIATDVNECPGSSLAFDSLVTAGYYNGKYFHRMVPNFVVQGGCPRGDGYGGMPWTLRTEIGRTPFTAGSVGLASAGPDTESCQFFITHSATPHLDGRYTRFGEVVSGMDVLWKLQVGDVMTRVEKVR